MSKGQSPTVKVSVCDFLISEVGSNCNLLLRPADFKSVTMKLKRTVEYSWECTFEPFIPFFLCPLYQIAIVVFQLLYQIGFLFPLDY